jgi:hypothetical protein
VEKRIKIKTNTMKDELNILTNLASNLSLRRVATESDLLELVNEAFENFSHVSALTAVLKKMKQVLIQPLSLEARPEVFEKLNLLVGAFFANDVNDAELYHLTFDIVSLVKAQIDSESQADDDLAEQEWEELEKSVYLLSDWQDQVYGDAISAFKN